MKVGDVVQHFLTEQLGIIVEAVRESEHEVAWMGTYHVMWTTQGQSLFGPGTKEWCDGRSIELVGAA